MSKTSNLKRGMKNLTEEEKLAKLKEKALQEEIDKWRAACLKKYTEKKRLGEL